MFADLEGKWKSWKRNFTIVNVVIVRNVVPIVIVTVNVAVQTTVAVIVSAIPVENALTITFAVKYCFTVNNALSYASFETFYYSDKTYH